MARSVALPRTEHRASALVRAVPAWAWLAGMVVVSAALRYALSRRMVAPWIMVDELVYSELAKSFAATGHFTIRDAPTAPYGFVYPLLIAPAYRLFDAVPTAYDAAKAINSLVMSLVAVPAYFLARRVLTQRSLALLAAALALAVPSMAYTGTLMTENAFYPLFVLFALQLVLVLERPTTRRQLVLLALFGAAFATRTQAVALLPAMLTAPLLLVWADRRGLRALRAYRLLYALTAAAAAFAALVQLARGRSLQALLGAYESAGNEHYAPGAVLRWLLYHLGDLDLYVGVVPFAALIVLAALARRVPQAAQAYVAATVALSAWLVLEVAAFASTVPIPPRVEERNMFYVAPLLVIALLVWIEQGMPRPRLAAGAAAVAAAALPGVLPYSSLIGTPTTSDTLVLVLWWRLQDRVVALSHVRAAAVVVAVALALVFLLLPRRAWAVLPLLVAGVFIAVGAAALDDVHGFRRASEGALFQGLTSRHRDWIDRSVGSGARVAVLWTGNADAHVVWENEFFNRSVGTVYAIGGPLPGGLPETPARYDRRSGFVTDDRGRPLRPRYVVSDGYLEPVGRRLAADLDKGVALYRLTGPLRAATRVDGLYPNDTWSGPVVRYLRRACRGGTLTVSLLSDGKLFERPQTVTARAGGRAAGRVVVPRGGSVRQSVPLRPVAGRCEAVFRVAPTAVPGNGDNRVLGIHFLSFAYSPPR